VTDLFRLFRTLSLRHLLAHRTRTALTVLGVALGVAVVVAVNAASRVALDAFSETADAIGGGGSLRIRVDGLDLDETVLERLVPLWEAAEIQPTLEERGRVDGPEGELLEILGLNLVADPRVVESVPDRDDRPDARLEALRDPRSIGLSTRFAARMRLAPGDSLRLHWGGRRATLRVAAVFPDEGPLRAFAGNTGIMDLAAFQETLGRPGRLDWIDLTPRKGVSADSLAAAARALLPAGFRLEPPAAESARLRSMVRAYRMNLLALGGVAALVGIFLVYNTVSTSVLSRREEIATLRALGAGRRQVLAVLAGEAAAIGLLGAAAGLVLARLLAEGAVRAVTETVYRVYGAIRPEAPRLDADAAALAAFLGVALAVLASIEPLVEAFRVRPVEFLRERRPGRPSRRHRSAILGAVFLLLAALLSLAPPIGGAPLFGYLSALLLVLGASLLLPAALTLLADGTSRVAPRLFAAEGRLAISSIRTSTARHAAATAALLVAIGMVVGMAVLVASFERTVLTWARQSLRADLWVEPAARTRGTLEGTLDPSVADGIAELPFVDAVDRFRGIEVLVEGGSVFLGAGEANILATRGALPLLDGRDPARVLPRLAGRDRVLVSEPFAEKRGTRPGDVIRIPTPDGVVPFEVEAVYRDYSTDRGYVVMDRATFLRRFADPALSTIAVYLRPGTDPDSARAVILAGAAPRGGEEFRVLTSGRLRTEIVRTLRSTFSVTYALTAIGLLVALLAISSTLAILVLEERRTIGVLRALGASPRQVRRTVILRALFLGGLGDVAGFATGFGLAGLLVYVINRQSFGWTLSFTVPWPGLAALFVAVPAVAALAGLHPARNAARVPPREAMSRD
jgi:putative ABC transport system permease protein